MSFGFTKVAMTLRTPAHNFSLAQKWVGVTSKRRQCSCRTCQTVYCRATAPRTDGLWIAGFYFNNALFRAAAVYHHRLLKVITGGNG